MSLFSPIIIFAPDCIFEIKSVTDIAAPFLVRDTWPPPTTDAQYIYSVTGVSPVSIAVILLSNEASAVCNSEIAFAICVSARFKSPIVPSSVRDELA